MAKVLLAGGSGYIGSHVAVALAAAGHEPVIVDSFANARREVVAGIARVAGREIAAERADIRDRGALDAALVRHAPDAVILLAGLKSVAESVARPLDYYEVNLGGAVTLMQALRAAGPATLIFSSSATVYGTAHRPPFTEDMAAAPVSPYGRSKRMIEEVMDDLAAAEPDRWRMLSLRYFNPVGAHPSGLIGEAPGEPPNNLFPIIADVAAGARDTLVIHGDDYETPDGTGVRDYLHVMDLAEGHVAAVDHALAAPPGATLTLNLGTGRGASVRDCLAAWERAVGRQIPARVGPRRPGDTAVSIADPARAAAVLGWRATRGLDEMCRDHWAFRSRMAGG